MRKLINRFRRDDEGAALVEYGMLVGLIAVICVVAVTTLGTEVSRRSAKLRAAWPAFSRRSAERSDVGSLRSTRASVLRGAADILASRTRTIGRAVLKEK